MKEQTNTPTKAGFLPAVANKVANTFRVIKGIWLSSGMSLSLIQGAALARWGSLEYWSLSVKAVQNAYAYRSITIIADTVASIPLVVERLENEEVDTMKEHPALELLRKPGQYGAKTKIQFFVQIIWDLHLGGEFFVWGIAPDTGSNAGKPQRLRLLRPDRVVDIETDETDLPTFYVYRNRKGKQKRIPADEVLHVKLYNPTVSDSEDERGLPILVAAIRAIELMRESEDWNKSIAQQKGKSPGIFRRTEKGATDQAKMKELREEAQKNWTQDAKNSTPGVMPYGWDFQEIGTSLKDAEFSESDRASMRKIAVALGVDPALLGDATNRTLANLREAVRGLLILRAIPILVYALDSLTIWFEEKNLMDSRERLAINSKEIEALQDELTARFERVLNAKKEGVYTIDEAREELSKPPRGGASARQYVPLNTIPLEEVGGSGVGKMLEDSDVGRELKSFSDSAFRSLLESVPTNGIH